MRLHKQILTTLMGLGLLLNVAFAQRAISNDGQTGKVRTFSGFNEVAIQGGMDVELVAGSSEKVEILSSNIDLDKIITEVNNGRLKVKLKRGNYHNVNIDMRITYKQLESVGVAGSGDIVAKSVLKSNELELSVAGSGSFKGEIQTKDLEMSISGSGDLYVSGQTDEQDISIAGSGNIHAYDLESNTAEVSISGSGDVRISVKEEIDARVAGSGDIRYKGDPDRVRSKAMGSGSIRKVN